MAKWLDKYEQGGLVLKQKTKDNYGKKPNPNDVKVSSGPGYVGMGNDITGRDYSPAWGGQFQSGGRLPIITSDPKDPRLQAYRDSLELYNRSMYNHKQLMRPDFALSLGGGADVVIPTYSPITKNNYERTFKSDEKDGYLTYAEDEALLRKTPEPELKALKLKSTYDISKKSKIRPVKNVQYNYGEGPYGGVYKTNMLFKKPVQPVEYKNQVEPIIVNDPNDPKLKAYQDSLSVYNKSKDLYDQLLSLAKQGNEGTREQVRDKMSLKDVTYFGNVGVPYSYKGIKPDYVLGTKTATENRGYLPHYKKPTQPVEYKKSEEVETIPEEPRLTQRIKAEPIRGERTPISFVPSLTDMPKVSIQLPSTKKEVGRSETPAEPVEDVKKTPIKDWIERMKLNREENKFRRGIQKGMKRQRDCWYGKCKDEDSDITQAQQGGSLWNTDRTAWVDSIHNARKDDLNFVKRYFDQSAGSIQIPGQRGTSTHFMESGDGKAYPTVVQMPNGKLQYLNQNDKDAAWKYANKTGQFIKFPTDEQAEWYANNGYKKGTGVLKKKQMGGSLPGAVGFTYARVAGSAPANGKYTKKTKASAQNGKEMQFYQDGLDWKPNSIAQDGNTTPSGKEFIDKWIQSPMYDQMLKTSSKNEKEYKTIKQGREENFSKPVVVHPSGNVFMNGAIGRLQEYRPEFKFTNEEAENAKRGGLKEMQDFIMKAYAPKITGYEVFVDKNLDQNDSMYQQVMAHEYGHREDAPWNFKDWNQEDYKQYTKGNKTLNYTPQADADRVKSALNFDPSVSEEYKKYLHADTGNIGEIRGILNEARYLGKANNIYDPYTEKITPEAFDKISNLKSGEASPVERLMKIFGSKEKAIELLNSVSKNKDRQPQTTAQDGGAIVDPMGQWAHPGEVTIIPATDITMEGVDYPVLGISDTGDTQYMEPGEDYNFDGEYVTEYPMMKKGGWLSKYQDGGGVLSRSNLETMAALEKDIKNQKVRNAQETVSQYTPKPGDQQRMNAAKDAYRAEEAKPLNRAASSRVAAKAMENIVEPMLAIETGMGVGNLAKSALKTVLKGSSKFSGIDDLGMFTQKGGNKYYQLGESKNLETNNVKINNKLKDWIEQNVEQLNIEPEPKPDFGSMTIDKVESENYLKNYQKNLQSNYNRYLKDRKEATEFWNEEVNILGKDPKDMPPMLRDLINDPNYKNFYLDLEPDTKHIAKGLTSDYAGTDINANLVDKDYLPKGGRALVTKDSGEGLFKKSADNFGDYKQVKPWEVFNKNFFIRKNKNGGWLTKYK